MKGWKQKFNNAEFGVAKDKAKRDDLIQWAGGLHQRSDFNKRRDQLGQWTEVLFHHWALIGSLQEIKITKSQIK